MSPSRGSSKLEEEQPVPLTDKTISSIFVAIQDKLPKIQKPKISRDEIARWCNLQVLEEFLERYINIIYPNKPSALISKISELSGQKSPTKDSSQK
jgi:hypothetical protein